MIHSPSSIKSLFTYALLATTGGAARTRLDSVSDKTALPQSASARTLAFIDTRETAQSAAVSMDTAVPFTRELLTTQFEQNRPYLRDAQECPFEPSTQTIEPIATRFLIDNGCQPEQLNATEIVENFYSSQAPLKNPSTSCDSAKKTVLIKQFIQNCYVEGGGLVGQPKPRNMLVETLNQLHQPEIAGLASRKINLFLKDEIISTLACYDQSFSETTGSKDEALLRETTMDQFFGSDGTKKNRNPGTAKTGFG